jgi:hypothetical protein
MSRSAGVFTLALMLMIPSASSAQERFGTLTGQVLDPQSTAIPAVTVTITNTQTGEVRTAVTDNEGRYRVVDLVPGRYNVRFSVSNFRPIERENILVLLGSTFDVSARLEVGTQAETVQVTAEATPLIDTRSVVISHNVTEEEFMRLPKDRSFQSIALAAPSVNSGEVEGGMQINGASGAENSFTVDGIVTNSLINGQSRQDTVFEYLQEVQVKTSGISAAYGGALGGVVSAVTKSGGNRFTGEVHNFFEGSAFRAAPVRRLVLDPQTEVTGFYVQDKEQPNTQNEFGGSLGGPIVRDRLFFFASYSPRYESRTNTYNFTDAVSDIGRKIWRQQAFGKVTYSGPRFTAHGSVLFTPWEADGTLQAYDGATPNAINRAQSGLAANIDRGYEISQRSSTGAVNYNLTNTSILSVRGGFFRDNYTDIATRRKASIT